MSGHPTAHGDTAALQATRVEYAVQTLVVESLAQKEAEAPAAEAMPVEAPLMAEAASEESSLVAEALSQSIPYPEPSQEALLKAAPAEALTTTPILDEEADISLTMIITATGVITTTREWGIGGGPPAITSTLELTATVSPTAQPDATSLMDLLPQATETVPPPSNAARPESPPGRAPSAFGSRLSAIGTYSSSVWTPRARTE